MDTDVLQAIQIIDKKIASLLVARNQLAQAFGIETASPAAPPKGTYVSLLPVPAGNDIESTNGNGHKSPSGRKVELAKFLVGKGAVDRATIIAESGLPEGTISYCLNDKRFFAQAPDGKWAITEYSRRGLERGSATGTFQPEAH